MLGTKPHRTVFVLVALAAFALLGALPAGAALRPLAPAGSTDCLGSSSRPGRPVAWPRHAPSPAPALPARRLRLRQARRARARDTRGGEAGRTTRGPLGSDAAIRALAAFLPRQPVVSLP